MLSKTLISTHSYFNLIDFINILNMDCDVVPDILHTLRMFVKQKVIVPHKDLVVELLKEYHVDPNSPNVQEYVEQYHFLIYFT